MCGIVGFWGMIPDDRRREAMVQMLSAIQHRGPDEFGAYCDPQVGLGSARLSIIDVNGGQQPMRSTDGRYTLVFNGEIFNYIELREELRIQNAARFRTESDTEVLLESLIAWGTDALARLNGQFAFCLYDHRAKTMLLARDRYGERPLFYWKGAGKQFAFASEIKALLTLDPVSRELDPAVLSGIYRHWTSPPERTCYREIHSLRPGTFMRLRAGEPGPVEHYWSPPVPQDIITDRVEAVAKTRKAVDAAVHLRMRSDVGYSVYLSGGLDSAIVAASAANQTSETLRSYSVEFADSDFDESSYQQKLANHLEVEHSSVKVGSGEIRRVFPEVLRHAETALFRAAPVPLYVLAQMVHGDGVKVVLTGEGADEQFVGYDIYKEAFFLASIDQFDTTEAKVSFIRRLYPYLTHFNERSAKSLMLYFENLAKNQGAPLLSHSARFAIGDFARRVLREPGSGNNGDEVLLEGVKCLDPEFLHRDPVRRAQVIELTTLLGGYLLSSQGDRMTAANSIEGRCPFLDPRVEEVAWSIPSAMHLQNGLSEKSVLKEAFSDLVPTEIVDRPKTPYRAPGASALRPIDGREDWVSDLVSDVSLAKSEMLDEKAAGRVVEQIRALPDQRISPRLDQTYMLILSTLLLETEPDLGAIAAPSVEDRVIFV